MTPWAPDGANKWQVRVCVGHITCVQCTQQSNLRTSLHFSHDDGWDAIGRQVTRLWCLEGCMNWMHLCRWSNMKVVITIIVICPRIYWPLPALHWQTEARNESRLHSKCKRLSDKVEIKIISQEFSTFNNFLQSFKHLRTKPWCHLNVILPVCWEN